MSLKKFFRGYALTKGQAKLIEQLDEFFKNDKFCFILKGAAGTGKTFITKGLTDYLDSIERAYKLAAPTGRAAKILSERTGKPASTIHRMIYTTTLIETVKSESNSKEIQPYYKVDSSITNDDTTALVVYSDDASDVEEIKFYFGVRPNNDNSDTVYIIDEASMISDAYSDDGFLRFGSGFLLRDLISYILYFDTNSKRKLILIGDNCQLPPVNMNLSPALDKDYLQNKYKISVEDFELTDVVRQDLRSGIISNATRIRNSIRQNIFNEIYIEANESDVQSLKSYEFSDKYLRIYSAYPPNETIVIAYTNFQVKEYNHWLRELIWGKRCELREGDRVIVAKNNYKYNLLNGEFCTIKSVGTQEIIPVKIKIKKDENNAETVVVNLIFRNVELEVDYSGEVINCKIIENFLYSDSPSLTREEQIALYVNFKKRHNGLKPHSVEFKEELRVDPYFNALQIKFGYAITCHKAQGGEWKNVFINCRSPNGYRNSNYFRWIYTAITRGKEKIYTIYEPDFRLERGLTKIESVPVTTFRNDLIILDEEMSITEIPEDFPEEPKIVRYIYYIITDLLKDENIIIEKVKHHQYAEHYYFSIGDEVLIIIIYYNNKGKISNIQIVNKNLSDWMQRLIELIKTLEGKTIHLKQKDIPQLQGEIDFEFPEDKPYLRIFYERVKQKVEEMGITITNIEHKDYHEIYTFYQDGITTTVKFYYNSKGIFTKYEVIQKRSTGLLKGIDEILR